MESVASFLCTHAPYAHYVLFALILVTGFNIPLPEDILCMIGGVLVATCVPEHYWLMFCWLYAGAIGSAYESYWIGRLIGPRLYDIHYFKHVITPHRVERIGHFLEKFGVFTFIVGRFIPFGVRNGVFLTSGLSKMPFPRFMLRDGIGALFATSALFHLGHEFGVHHALLFHYFHNYEMIVLLALITVIIVASSLFYYLRKASNKNTPS